jgi:hypothetical protein
MFEQQIEKEICTNASFTKKNYLNGKGKIPYLFKNQPETSTNILKKINHRFMMLNQIV